jgi:hypothetical protein
MRRFVACMLALVLTGNAQAQMEPREALSVTITGLQTGRLYTPLFSPQVVEQLRLRTNHSMVVPELAALGKVTSITVTTSQPFASGILYDMVATHERGRSNWRVALAQSPPFHPGPDTRVEHVEFGVEAVADDAARRERACVISPFMCK